MLLLLAGSSFLVFSIVIAHTNATPTRGTAITLADVSHAARGHAARNPYPPYTGSLALSDPLSNNGQGHGWDVYSVPVNATCRFSAGAYESTIQNVPRSHSDVTNRCVAENTHFTNVVFQVEVTIMKGGCGGLAFRGNSNTHSGYIFVVCASANRDHARGRLVFAYLSGGYYNTTSLTQVFSPGIHTTYGQTNVLAVVAIGHALTFYANGKKLTTVIQSAYNAGQIGLVSSGTPAVLDVVMFRNAKVWTM